jgi:hypothetical protein
LLGERTGDPKWRNLAANARNFVGSMWNADCACFAAGTAEDGVTPNPTLSLDAQVWPLIALSGAAATYGAVRGTLTKRLAVQGGYSYGEAKDGVWTEGTAQMALLEQLSGHEAESRALRGVVERQRSPDGGYYATSADQLPTGYGLESDPSKPRLYFRLPHLGAASWVALAETGFNPFTLRR